LFHANGTDIAGWPEMLNMEVPAMRISHLPAG
jgi:hypothetical protein